MELSGRREEVHQYVKIKKKKRRERRMRIIKGKEERQRDVEW
jgi:hypothetical protein